MNHGRCDFQLLGKALKVAENSILVILYDCLNNLLQHVEQPF